MSAEMTTAPQKKMSPLMRKISSAISANKDGAMTPEELAKATKSTIGTIYTTLYMMESAGIVKRQGIKHSPKGPERAKYSLA